MDLVFQSLLPSAQTNEFKDKVAEIIDVPAHDSVPHSSQIIWIDLEHLISEYATKSPAVFKEWSFFLHRIVAKHPPLALVKSIVEMRPESLLLLDVYRDQMTGSATEATPLGIACRSRASVPVIRFLIRAMLNIGTDPIHKDKYEAFEKGRPGGLFATADFSPSMPLDILNALLEEHPNGVQWQHKVFKESLAAWFAFCPDKLNTEDYLEKLRLVLMAASCGSIIKERTSEQSTFSLPHAFLEVVTCAGRCRKESMKQNIPQGLTAGEVLEQTLVIMNNDVPHIFKEHIQAVESKERDYFGIDEDKIVDVLLYLDENVPNQFRVTDTNGNLPFHIALWNRKFQFNCRKRRYGEKVLKTLLDIYPDSISIPDGKGRLPLHIAIATLMPCTHKIIIEKSPPWVLERKMDGVYPFQMVPICQSSGLNEDQLILWLEISFILLTKAPLLARGLAENPKPWLDSVVFREIQIAKMNREIQSARIAVLSRKLDKLKASGD